jgi:predicted O-methyltransferase YrrM
MHEIARKFLPSSPYDNFPLDEYQYIEHGWHYDHAIFEILINLLRPKTIIEVGSWKGMSAIKMAKICDDTWLGGVEHWDMPDGEDPMKGYLYATLDWKNGRPDIYNQFIANVIYENQTEKIVPLANTSQNAYKILKRVNITADLIYVDGSHEIEDVYMDINNYWKLLSSGGVMFGDDLGWVGVKGAVGRWSKHNNIPYENFDDNFWQINKV